MKWAVFCVYVLSKKINLHPRSISHQMNWFEKKHTSAPGPVRHQLIFCGEPDLRQRIVSRGFYQTLWAQPNQDCGDRRFVVGIVSVQTSKSIHQKIRLATLSMVCGHRYCDQPAFVHQRFILHLSYSCVFVDAHHAHSHYIHSFLAVKGVVAYL